MEITKGELQQGEEIQRINYSVAIAWNERSGNNKQGEQMTTTQHKDY